MTLEAAERQPEEVEEAKLWDESNDKNCINARSASIESSYTIVNTSMYTMGSNISQVDSNISRRNFIESVSVFSIFCHSPEIFNSAKYVSRFLYAIFKCYIYIIIMLH